MPPLTEGSSLIVRDAEPSPELKESVNFEVPLDT